MAMNMPTLLAAAGAIGKDCSEANKAFLMVGDEQLRPRGESCRVRPSSVVTDPRQRLYPMLVNSARRPTWTRSTAFPSEAWSCSARRPRKFAWLPRRRPRRCPDHETDQICIVCLTAAPFVTQQRDQAFKAAPRRCVRGLFEMPRPKRRRTEEGDPLWRSSCVVGCCRPV